MKIKSKKFVSNRANQGKMYLRSNYGRYNGISSGLNSMDFYQQNQSFRRYSKYKYIDTSVKRPIRSNDKKRNSRSVSPVLGSEEYMTKKIEQTSAIIMRQLLNPNDQNYESISSSIRETGGSSTRSHIRNETSESSSSLISNCNKNKIKRNPTYNIDEIHEKIMNHITKLNDGKKKNLINSSMSGYDTVIEQIQKQKRLEISRALRTMWSQSKERKETNDFINSIIPDIGIKIEDLPHDLIEELRNTLDIDQDWSIDDLSYNNLTSEEFSLGSHEIYTELKVDDFAINPIQISVKLEPTDSNFLFNKSDQNSKQINGSMVNELESDNIDKRVNNKNTYTTNEDNITTITSDKNDFENTIIAIKKEIYDQPESEYSDNINKENLESSTIVNVKSEFCQDSHQTSSGVVKSITGADDLELDTVRTPLSVTQMETCDTTEEKKNEEDNGQILILPIEKSDREKMQEINVKNKFDILMSNTSTQTDEEYDTHCTKKCIDHLLTKCHQQAPKNLSEAIKRMFEIDECILKLTNYRQSLFANPTFVDEFARTETNYLPAFANHVFPGDFNEGNCKTQSSVASITVTSKKRKKKKKLAGLKSVNNFNGICNYRQPAADNTPQRNCFEGNCVIENITETGKSNVSNNIPKNCHNKKNKSVKIVDSLISKGSEIKKQNLLTFKGITEQPKHLELLDLHEKILVIKVVEDKLLVAGTESGKIIFYCLETGHYNKILHICHVPITSLLFRKHTHSTTYMYVGSFDSTLKIYSLHNYSVVESIPLDDKIQCMECNWGYIFIGCVGGSLLRYKPQKKVVEFGDKYSDNSILVLKATQEGARRILLIGSRNSPVCIRDALTGLYMRTMEDVISPTVYSLILNKNLVYCGTSSHDILVYSFHDGKLVHRYKATDSKGIGYMKIEGNLLFASCHNGNIYVYDVKQNTFISSIQGPGGVILSMEIFGNRVIIGTMSFKFMSLPIPQHILQHKICS